MLRRAFLATLAVLPVAVSRLFAREPELAIDEDLLAYPMPDLRWPYPSRYIDGPDGYKVSWTGFKTPLEGGHSVGQWVAWPPPGHPATRLDKPGLYVYVPGGEVGEYSLGGRFDVQASLASREARDGERIANGWMTLLMLLTDRRREAR